MQECWEGMTINILDLIELVFWCILFIYFELNIIMFYRRIKTATANL